MLDLFRNVVQAPVLVWGLLLLLHRLRWRLLTWHSVLLLLLLQLVLLLRLVLHW